MNGLTRRNILQATIPAAMGARQLGARPASGYNLEEIERKLRPGNSVEGVSKQDLPTPALIADIDRVEANIAKMMAHARKTGVDLRPHAKTHKTPAIAKRQLAAGAVGVCAATIREAEAMAAAGIGGLLVTGELTGPNKIHRLIRLTRRQPDTLSVIDSPLQAEWLSEAAGAAKVQLHVLIDVDPVGRRTGIEPGTGAVELAKKVDSLPGLKLRGVHGYSGMSSHVTGFADRKEHSFRVMKPVIETFRTMRKSGLPVEIMSGASTGTYNIDTLLDGMTELQVGSYVFMDVDYRRIGGLSGGVYNDFQPSLTVLATVMSKNYDETATIDAGLKAFATDRKFGPEVVGMPGVEYKFNGDEHGKLYLREAGREVKLGDKVELLIPHCDPNVNLYDRMYACRGDQVTEVWKIAARGHV